MKRTSWQTKKLCELCDFHNGLWKGKEPPYIKVGVIRNTNFTKDGELDDADIAYLDVEKKQFEQRKLFHGDIILEKSGGGPKQPVGRVIIFDKKEGDFSFSNFTSAIRIKRKDQIDFKYLHKYLFFSYMSGVTEAMQSHSTGIRNLNFKLFKEIGIPFPSFIQQNRIVRILEEVFEGVARAKENAEKNLESAYELFESYLRSVFANPSDGWKEKKLIEMCEIRPPKNEARVKLKDTDTVSFVPMEDLGIKQKWLVPIKQRTLKEVEGSYTYFADRDVLLAKITPCFENGKLGVARNLKNGIGFGSSEFIVFRTSKNLLPEFLYYYLLREEFRQEGLNRMKGAVGHKRISKEFVENAIIIVPSLLVQNQIVDKFDRLSARTERLEAIYKQKLGDLEELKKSILQKAFNGNLVGAS